MDILNKIQSNNQQAINEAYATLRPRFIRKLVNEFRWSTEDAEDVYQDAFLILIEKVKQPDGIKGKLPAYLLGIGRNLAMLKMRKDKTRPQHQHQVEENAVVVDGYTALEEWKGQFDHELEEMKASMLKLGSSCFRLLNAFYLEQKPMKDIAEELAYMNAQSAKSQKAKCMRKLRQIYTRKRN